MKKNLPHNLHAKILKVCMNIQHMPYEVGVWLDQKGNELYGVTTYDDYCVAIYPCNTPTNTIRIGDRAKYIPFCRAFAHGKIFVHNHPNRKYSRLSDQDINWSRRNKCGIVAIARGDKDLNYDMKLYSK